MSPCRRHSPGWMRAQEPALRRLPMRRRAQTSESSQPLRASGLIELALLSASRVQEPGIKNAWRGNRLLTSTTCKSLNGPDKIARLRQRQARAATPTRTASPRSGVNCSVVRQMPNLHAGAGGVCSLWLSALAAIAPRPECPSRIRQHLFVPAARFLRPGFAFFASLTPIEGWRSAERRTGACEAPVGLLRLQARRFGGLTVAILGSGAALASPAFAPDRLQRAP